MKNFFLYSMYLYSRYLYSSIQTMTPCIDKMIYSALVSEQANSSVIKGYRDVINSLIKEILIEHLA